MYKVRLICIVICRLLTGQRHLDEVLHQYVLQIYQTVKPFSLPARQCQHTCNMPRNCLQASHFISPSLAFRIPIRLRSSPLGYSRTADT